MAKYAKNIFLRNIWFSACNIDIMVVHIPGKMNPVLSRWHITANNVSKLQHQLHPVTWIPTSVDLLYCDNTI